MRSGDRNAAEQLLKAAIDDEMTDGRIELAMLYTREGDRERAKKLLQLGGDDAEVLAKLGELYIEEGDSEIATRILRKAVQLESKTAMLSLTKILEESGQIEEASSLKFHARDTANVLDALSEASRKLSARHAQPTNSLRPGSRRALK